MAKVKVSKENVPKGTTVEVPDLGYFPNGETTELDDTVWKRYRLQHGLDLPDNHTVELNVGGSPVREPIRLEETEGSPVGAEPEPQNIDNMRKDQLVDLAESRGINTEGKKADELREALSPGSEKG